MEDFLEAVQPRNTLNTLKPMWKFYSRIWRVSRLILLYRAIMNSELIFKEESYKIIGACFEVYREKGCGFLEPVYQDCMELELRLQGILFVPQKPLPLEYKGTPLACKYEPDFMCYEKIILELKAVKELLDEH